MQMIETTSLPTEAPDFDDVIVNGKTIEATTILQEMQYYPAETMEDSRQQAAQSLVVRELLLQRAKELNLVPDDSDADYEQLISTLLEQEVDLSTADQETCERYFEANMERFKTPVLIAASHILLGADPNDLEERAARQAEAESLISTLQDNPDRFAALAQLNSDCPSKEVGGQMGQLDKGQTVPEFERQVFNLDVGLAERPVESRYGFHVVRIDQRVEGEQLPYEAVEDRIRMYLQERNYRRAVNQYIQLLAGDAEIAGIELLGADALLVQ